MTGLLETKKKAQFFLEMRFGDLIGLLVIFRLSQRLFS